MSDRIEEIRADYENISSELTVLPSEYQIGWDDLGFILSALAARDAEIERLKTAGDAMEAILEVIEEPKSGPSILIYNKTYGIPFAAITHGHAPPLPEG